MISKEDVYALAKSIVESGYFPNEVLVAVREQSKLVVVEGNRRLAACKLLISPEAAPASFQAKFRSLSVKANLSQLKEIPVCIAPSREATHATSFEAVHTKLPISKMGTCDAGQIFTDNLIERGMSIEEIAKTSGQGNLMFAIVCETITYMKWRAA